MGIAENLGNKDEFVSGCSHCCLSAGLNRRDY